MYFFTFICAWKDTRLQHLCRQLKLCWIRLTGSLNQHIQHTFAPLFFFCFLFFVIIITASFPLGCGASTSMAQPFSNWNIILIQWRIMACEMKARGTFVTANQITTFITAITKIMIVSSAMSFKIRMFVFRAWMTAAASFIAHWRCYQRLDLRHQASTFVIDHFSGV